MNPQRRLIEARSDAIGIAANVLTQNLTESSSVNVHGLRACGSIEPENTDANANGFWIVYCFPSTVIGDSGLPSSFGDLDDKLYNPYVWGIGCWTASNQAPFHFEFTPSTSRTCQRGARIVFQVEITGVSAGNVRVNQTMTMFTTD